MVRGDVLVSGSDGGSRRGDGGRRASAVPDERKPVGGDGGITGKSPDILLSLAELSQPVKKYNSYCCYLSKSY